VPPDTRAPGYNGHISDHNAISDSLSALYSSVGLLQAAVAGGITPSSVQNASYTLAAADLGSVVEVNAGSPVTVTIPPSAQTAFPVGAVLWIARTGTGTVTIAAGTGVTLLSPGGLVTVSAQYAEVKLRQRILNTWMMTGSLA
jgi:hypothetical protein